MTREPLVAIDLFAGCGGLSLGLAKAGINVVAAVEIDEHSTPTYIRNHPRTRLIQADIQKVSGDELREAAGGRDVDLVAGCAPCQGFCSLTAKNAREDPRNLLLLEMGRLVEELQPTAVMMENVPGLERKGEGILADFRATLSRLGYYHQTSIVQMADYGVPQYRRRLVLLAGKGFVIPLPPPTHARLPREGDGRRPWRTLRDILSGNPAPVRFSEAVRRGGPRSYNWHVVRDLQPQTKARLRAAIPGMTWLAYDESIRPACHRDGYEGFTNVYGRMSWDRESVTITGGCTTPCKGRFGHPDRRRTTISVREAATIQTFPKNYVFATDQMEAVCQMIGNAVPPLFGRIVGQEIIRSIRAHHGALAECH